MWAHLLTFSLGLSLGSWATWKAIKLLHLVYAPPVPGVPGAVPSSAATKAARRSAAAKATRAIKTQAHVSWTKTLKWKEPRTTPVGGLVEGAFIEVMGGEVRLPTPRQRD